MGLRIDLPNDVLRRHQLLRERWPDLRLLALVDGLAYEEHLIERLEPRPGVHALFEGSPDAALAHAGGWLIEPDLAGPLMKRDLFRLEPKAPAVCWFFTRHHLGGLLPHLRQLLSLTLPDGREALLRYYDPRVLVSLLRAVNAEPRSNLNANPFGFALEWHLWLDGKRVHPSGLVAEAEGTAC
jgi:hypothetical protein